MKMILIYLISLLFFVAGSFGQQKFCGLKYKDTSFIREQLNVPLAFLKINNGDTVIDIGTSSGAYIGAICTIALFSNVHFIGVDIDSNCLNPIKVNNMFSYYQALYGASFSNTFSFVINTADSLYLPLNCYKKILIINTLHEIPDKEKIARQIVAVLKIGGELIVGEIPPTGKRTIHQGCNQPLMGVEEIVNLFTRFGFKFIEKENVQGEKHKDKHPIYYYRFVKIE